MDAMDEIRSDIVEEAARVTAAANDVNVPLRLIGGLAIRLPASDALPPMLQRTYQGQRL
jgi:hypothetical protein